MQGQAHRNRSHQRLGVLQMPYCFILIAYRPWQGQSVISQDQPNLTAPFLEPAFRVNSGNPEKEQAALAKTRQNGGFFCHTRHHSGQPCRAFFMKLSSQSSPGLSRSVFSFRKAPSGSKRSKLLPNFFFYPRSGNSEMQAVAGCQGPQAAGSLAQVAGQREPENFSPW